MKMTLKQQFLALAAALGVLGALAVPAQASPAEDAAAYRAFFTARFPGVAPDEFANGVYAIDPVARANWEAIEEFPPYEAAVDEGRRLFAAPFADGTTYADCFPNKGVGIAGNYPYWDRAAGEVVTLELAVQRCRQAHGEAPLPANRGKLAALLAYMAYTSRGKPVHVEVPADDPRALAAYEAGKQFYFTRRGQLNFACAHCHFQNAGQQLRTEVLSPALGHATHWPVYRAKWGEVGTLHRRFQGCNEQVRAKKLPAQSVEYRNLEYFLTHMSNGLPLNGPAARK